MKRSFNVTDPRLYVRAKVYFTLTDSTAQYSTVPYIILSVRVVYDCTVDNCKIIILLYEK
jgi:hypothetical protein